LSNTDSNLVQLKPGDLSSSGRHIPVPFNLCIQDAGAVHDIRFESILRLVPGRRLTGLAHWQGNRIIAKLFFQPGSWQRKCSRDKQGIQVIMEAGISTPRLIESIDSDAAECGVLLIEYLENGEGLRHLIETAVDDEQCLSVLSQVVQIIARSHDAGLWQKDIHLGNFMLQDGRVYLLDGGDIGQSDGSLGLDTRLNNLALFFAQLTVDMDTQIPILLDEYVTNTGVAAVNREEFLQRVVQARTRRLKVLENKLFRSTTAHCCLKTRTRFLVYDRAIHSAAVERFVRNPDEFIDEDSVIKPGNSSTVSRIELDETSYVLKRYNIKNKWHGIKRLFRPSRAHHSWRNAAVLEMLGISTSHPYLLMEERILGVMRRRAFFLGEQIAGPTLAELIEADNGDEVMHALAQLQQYLTTFATYLISHGDMKASNFIFSDGCLYVLDLDSMKRHQQPATFARAYLKDLMRLQKNFLGTRYEDAVERMIVNLKTHKPGISQ